MKYSFIITAWKEPATVSETIKRVIEPVAGNLLDSMEIVLVCPDIETQIAALNIVETYKFKDFIYIKDENKGKPCALNLAIQNARGEILIFTDGDVVIGENSLQELVEPFNEPTVGGVTGHPKSYDSKETMFGYWGNLLADAAHAKRSKEFEKGNFYFMSGYLFAMKRFEDIYFPEDILVDDAWITLEIVKKGYKIAYSPDSLVYIKYPQNFTDWINQKKRSVGGYIQLKSLEKEIVKSGNDIGLEKRSMMNELKFIFFPLKYAENVTELVYSLMLYPSRLYLWFLIWYQKKRGKKTFKDTWVRIESTK